MKRVLLILLLVGGSMAFLSNTAEARPRYYGYRYVRPVAPIARTVTPPYYVGRPYVGRPYVAPRAYGAYYGSPYRYGYNNYYRNYSRYGSGFYFGFGW